jgi:hypothetical protein
MGDRIGAMTERRDRVARQVAIASLFVAIIFFVLSFYVLVAIGFWTGMIKLHLFEPAPYSRDWSETLWWLVVWGGSSGLSILSFRAFFRFAKKFIPLR